MKRKAARGRQIRKPAICRPNGYVLEPVLILFAFSILFCLYAVKAAESRAALIQASRRSEIDLAILEEAKYLAGEITWKRRCHMEEERFSSSKIIAGQQVQFTDHQTWLHAAYRDQSRSFGIDVYYDETGIVKIEYSRP